MKVIDVSDISADPALFVIGGFVGELILTFNAMRSCITLNPQQSEFRFEVDKIVEYISECLDDYPEAVAFLWTCTSPNNEDDANPDEKAKIEYAVNKLMEPNVLS